MNYEPIELSIERRASSTAGNNRPRQRPPIRPYFAPKPESAAPPEALDEVFASLAQNASDPRQADATIGPGKVLLDTAPIVALAANLERQHERLTRFLRELETGVRN